MSNKIKIPKLNKKLAEEIGIHIGDGSLGIYPKTGHYRYTVCSGFDDKIYIFNFVKPLIEKLYGITPNNITKKKGKSLDLVYHSKDLILWKNKIGLPIGPKNQIKIPKLILHSPFILDCIRGIFDTDGTVLFKKRNKDIHYYPVIKLYCKSKPLIKQIDKVLLSIGIKSNIQYDVRVDDKRGFISVTHQLHINGENNVEKFMKKVGFSNIKHKTKYLVWKKNGHLEPGTTLDERLKILKIKVPEASDSLPPKH